MNLKVASPTEPSLTGKRSKLRRSFYRISKKMTSPGATTHYSISYDNRGSPSLRNDSDTHKLIHKVGINPYDIPLTPESPGTEAFGPIDSLELMLQKPKFGDEDKEEVISLHSLRTKSQPHNLNTQGERKSASQDSDNGPVERVVNQMSSNEGKINDTDALGMTRQLLLPCEFEGPLSPDPSDQVASGKSSRLNSATDSTSTTSGASKSALTTPSSPISYRSVKYNPIEQVQHDMQSLVGGDAVFTVSMDHVLSKLVIALGDRNSTYLFRDFAGHFVTLLDRFGPGGYDSQRAPVSVSWVLKLIVPWTYIDDDADLNQVSVYEEVNCWLRNICSFLGPSNKEIALMDDIWDTCVEHMASANPYISEVAYRTAKTIATTWTIDDDLIYRVLLMRNVTFAYEKEAMRHFRNHHVKLMKLLLERIHKVDSEGVASQHKDLVMSINCEIENLFVRESDPTVRLEMKDTLDYATEVYNTLEDILFKNTTTNAAIYTPISPNILRRSINYTHWALTSSKLPESHTSPSMPNGSKNSTTQKPSQWRRLRQKLRSLFLEKPQDKSRKDLTIMSPSEYWDSTAVSSPNIGTANFHLTDLFATPSSRSSPAM